MTSKSTWTHPTSPGLDDEPRDPQKPPVALQLRLSRRFFTGIRGEATKNRDVSWGFMGICMGFFMGICLWDFMGFNEIMGFNGISWD